jgi:MFS family permease
LRARNPRAALATVVAEGFLGRLAFGMLGFALPLYALSLGISIAQIGLLVSLRTVLVLPLKPVAGWLSDRIGIRTVYLFGAFARVIAAAALLVVDGFLGLMFVRALQGASAAGRDVASLGVIARDAEARIGSAYSWYSSAKHVGGVAGAGLAGVIIAASGGAYGMLFALILALSVLPTAAAWIGLREVPDESPDEPVSDPRETVDEGEAEGEPVGAGRVAGVFSLLRELSGPASVGALVATSAYMVHGLFPVLATEYVGLSAAQAGIIYSLSAAVFLVTGPVFGWVIDRHGRLPGIAWRSAANVGSSVLYLASPTFVGLAAARSVDDSGKAAFKPAWASAVAEIAAADKPRRGRRLGALDTSQSLGEAIGPALAGFLWQTGGIVALFGVRIAIAVVAEIAALRVFGELKGRRGVRPRPSPTATAVAYLAPPTLALTATAAWLGYASGWGTSSIPPANLALAGGVALFGIVAGALAGGATAAAERRAVAREREEALGALAHDLRAPLTVIRGETELVLSQDDTPAEERRRSSATVTDEVDQIDHLLRRRHPGK